MPQEELRVLLIEHDPAFARYMGEMLGQAREMSARMEAAADLTAGISLLVRNNFDVVVVDLCVPDGAGLANLALIRAEAPRLPIIAAGEADDEIVALEAVHEGAQDYLVKSQLTPGWLERSIRYAMSGTAWTPRCWPPSKSTTACSTTWWKAFSKRPTKGIT
jgi:DNA-binding NarL/FixJ family response regulator